MSSVGYSRTLFPALVSAFVVVGAVLLAGFLIVATPAWSDAEAQAIAAVGRFGAPWLDAVAVGVDVAFGPLGAVALILLVVVRVAVRGRSVRRGLAVATWIAVPWAVAEAVKLVVRRPRPGSLFASGPVATPESFSFPSGHTAFAAALCCAVILALAPGRTRRVAIVVGVVIVLVTAWSRVRLGVHYPSDVVASMLLAPVVSVAANRCTGAMTPGRGRVLAVDAERFLGHGQ
ncbi:phosphatase PAP2 family protein [Propionicicella superfundia]|uniref:phosphatase PAP2 family protein n=1 Tax=Propionicicella superfundia TaxID=348582 RepID=UPI0003FA7062|nr:phosphatase PAP2 family protein [Propionicicella superfundia]